MKVFNVTAARANFYKLVDEVIESGEPVTIARGDGKAVVLVSMAEWEQLRKLIVAQIPPASTQAPQLPAGQAGRGRAVVTLETGDESVHGPYKGIDQAGRMGQSQARSKSRKASTREQVSATYRIQLETAPDVWVDWTPNRSWEQHWIPADRRSTDVRKCANCGFDVVRFDGGWTVVDDDHAIDGFSSCPPGAPLNESFAHTPVRETVAEVLPIIELEPENGVDYWVAKSGAALHERRVTRGGGDDPLSIAWCGAQLVDQVRAVVGQPKCTRCPKYKAAHEETA